MQEKTNQDTITRVLKKEEYIRNGLTKSNRSRGRNIQRKNRNEKTGINKCRLYIGNLNYSTSSAEITKTFENFGKIVSYDLKTGYAFVEYENPEQAEKAKREMNLKVFKDRVIILRNAKPLDESDAYYSESSSSLSSNLSPRYNKKSVDPGDKETCFFCGQKGHWKKECAERRRLITKKIRKGEIEKDLYKEHIIARKIPFSSRSNSSNKSRDINATKRSKDYKSNNKRGRSRNSDGLSNKNRFRSNSSSLSYSIPSDCSKCKLVLKEIKKKKAKAKKSSK